jgi:hypothetical protein
MYKMHSVSQAHTVELNSTILNFAPDFVNQIIIIFSEYRSSHPKQAHMRNSGLSRLHNPGVAPFRN